jgi:hypothetical protein
MNRRQSLIAAFSAIVGGLFYTKIESPSLARNYGSQNTKIRRYNPEKINTGLMIPDNAEIVINIEHPLDRQAIITLIVNGVETKHKLKSCIITQHYSMSEIMELGRLTPYQVASYDKICNSK